MHGNGIMLLYARVETVAWLNQFRRLRVRYEKRADTDEAFLAVACAVICGKVFQKRPW